MLSLKEIIEEKNKKCSVSYLETLKKIKSIREETQDSEESYLKYAYTIADKILFN